MEDITVSCAVSFATEADFKSYCTNSPTIGYKKSNWKIFNQFVANFKYLGIFGNANVDYTQDWTSVLYDNMDQLTQPNTGTFDSDTNTCTTVTSLEVEIITSKVGFEDNP